MFAILCAVGLAGCLLAVLLLAVSYARDKSMVLPLILFVIFLLLAGAGIFLEWKGVSLEFSLPFLSGGAEDRQEPEPAAPADEDVPEDGGEGEGDASEPRKDPSTDVFGLGETAVLDGVQVTLTNVSESQGKDFLTPSAGCVYILCAFEIANGSEEDITVSSVMSFDAYIDDYAAPLNISAMSSADEAQLDGGVASGKKMRGIVGYEGPSDWSEIEIRFAPNFWNGESITFVYSK